MAALLVFVVYKARRYVIARYCYTGGSVCLSVRPSVRHIRDPRTSKWFSFNHTIERYDSSLLKPNSVVLSLGFKTPNELPRTSLLKILLGPFTSLLR